MTIKERLRFNFPKTFDTSQPNFSAIIANDKGDAAIEKVLTDLKNYMNEWKNSKNLYEQENTLLDKTASFISFLKRFNNETDKSYKNRLAAIFVRKNDNVWGTSLNIVHVFNQYFSSGKIFLAETTNDENLNLIKDFDFDSATSDKWNLTNAEISSDARFSKTYGVKFNQNGTLKQTIMLSDYNLKEVNNVYFLHFFSKGNIKVQIKNTSTNKFWDGKEWKNSTSYIVKDSNDWTDQELSFIRLEDTNEIELSFISNDGLIDYIRLTQYIGYPTFTIYAQFEGANAKESLVLAPGQEDEQGIMPYEKAGYYEQSFLTGASAGHALDLYEDLLNYVRPQGVKGYLKIINKDYIE